jgi:transposase-like protein
MPPELINHPFVVYQQGVIQSLTKAVESYRVRTQELESQLKWFQKQIFGQKSERRVPEEMPINSTQLPLAIELPAIPPGSVVVKTTTVPEHSRKKSVKVLHEDNSGESGLRFGPNVRVVEKVIPNPAVEGLKAGVDYEVVAERIQDKLCQEKSAYFIERYKQQVVKFKATERVVSPPAPPRVINSAYADISLLVGMCIDKFLYHLPINRQHQRMARHDIHLSRATLINWIGVFIDLFKPVYNAQLSSIVAGSVLSIDETPFKIGHHQGKMVNQYLWFLYGDKHEVLIHPNKSRGSEVVKGLIEETFKGVIMVDGHSAYTAAAKELNLQVSNCWAHARRYFVEAEEQEPLHAGEAVLQIREIYALESLAPGDPGERLLYRLAKVKPLVDTFFDWLMLERDRLTGIPKTSYSKAVFYALRRKAELTVFLNNPAVPIDNNHTERQIRPLVLGRKNFLFCWTELGAERLAVIQSLILTCQLHGVDPWDYLTDVAVRIDSHKATDVQQLIPRIWKKLFDKNDLEAEKLIAA